MAKRDCPRSERSRDSRNVVAPEGPRIQPISVAGGAATRGHRLVPSLLWIGDQDDCRHMIALRRRHQFGNGEVYGKRALGVTSKNDFLGWTTLCLLPHAERDVVSTVPIAVHVWIGVIAKDCTPEAGHRQGRIPQGERAKCGAW